MRRSRSFARPHRSHLVAMGVLPLEFKPGRGRRELGLTGRERFDVEGLASLAPGSTLRVGAVAEGGRRTVFTVQSRVDTAADLDHYRQGGILPWAFRRLLGLVPA
jgi:aconitate hydratase